MVLFNRSERIRSVKISQQSVYANEPYNYVPKPFPIFYQSNIDARQGFKIPVAMYLSVMRYPTIYEMIIDADTTSLMVYEGVTLVGGHSHHSEFQPSTINHFQGEVVPQRNSFTNSVVLRSRV
jgi:hypothetical protein